MQSNTAKRVLKASGAWSAQEKWKLKHTYFVAIVKLIHVLRHHFSLVRANWPSCPQKPVATRWGMWYENEQHLLHHNPPNLVAVMKSALHKNDKKQKKLPAAAVGPLNEIRVDELKYRQQKQHLWSGQSAMA